ncbi:MAG TPA: hypothetical protein VJH06_02195 [Candidatus Paceibacterota bacterium]
MTKLISAFLIVAMLLPAVLLSAPKRAEATAPVWDYINGIILALTGASTTGNTATNISRTALAIKTFAKEVAKQVLMAVARKALQEITKSTINWINSGFHGSPLFLENPQSFFTDIVKSEVKTLVNEFGYDALKYPFGKDFSLSIINAYKRKLSDNMSYSLGVALADPVYRYNYQNNFNTGGWNAFIVNTQFPQNNSEGFQIKATNEIASRIQGVAQNEAQKLKDVLLQGAGFLSPQTCATNPDYNSVYNQFNQPTFNEGQWRKDHPYKPPSCTMSLSGKPCTVTAKDIFDYNLAYDKALAEAKAAFNDPKGENGKNVCPPQEDGSPGLIATTPGAVISNQITDAMGSHLRQTELGAAMGNSLSAIFDALLNHFLEKGLNALSSKINPQPPEDDWSYNGQTLGTAPVGANTPWEGPDQTIVLPDFKRKVDTAVENTTKELLAMTNDTPNDSGPGIMQIFGQIWPKVQQLDICQPGPDMGWQARVDQESQRNSVRLQEDLNSNNEEAVIKANLDLKELKFATDFFKDWLSVQTNNALPSSSSNVSAVSDLPGIYQQAGELTIKIGSTKTVLSILQEIKSGLDAITTTPNPGSDGEKSLVSLWKQYEAISESVTNDISLEETRIQLAAAKSKSANLDKLITQCAAERTAKGWSNPGGTESTMASFTEKATFCDGPIAGGYSHGSFVNSGTVNYPKLPLVNAQNISTVAGSVNISLSCSIIYTASASDYKGSLPSF